MTPTEVIATLSAIPMYRGARVGDPYVLKGPSYFISSESFARTYGPIAQFQLNVKKPLIVSDEEWFEYTTHAFTPVDEAARKVRKLGYDSVVNVRMTPAGTELWTVFLVNPKRATLVRSNPKSEITFGSFPKGRGPDWEEDSADIFLNGVKVGYITRDVTSDWASATSRRLASKVVGYRAVLFDVEEEPTAPTLAELRALVRTRLQSKS